MVSGERGRPFLIGLTGNIATGKSAVAKMLEELGAATVDADKVAHQAMQPGTQTHAEVVAEFGPGILKANGEIDRGRLGAIVFDDEASLARLESIVHPATLDEIRRRVATATAAVVVIEAIKLIESSLAEECDSVWVTVSRPDQQMERLVSQRHLDPAEARRRVEAQGSPAQRTARADVVIDNRDTLAETRKRVLAAWERVVTEEK